MISELITALLLYFSILIIKKISEQLAFMMFENIRIVKLINHVFHMQVAEQ